MNRCLWVNNDNDLYVKYHDEQWGVPVFDDNILFEMLILEGMQAGLSWETILNKRNNYKESFDNFNPKKVALYDDIKQLELLNNKGIIRNKNKIQAAITNAKVFLSIQDEYGSFSNYIWEFVGGKQIQNNFKYSDEIPCRTELSAHIAKDLKAKGMKYVGPVIIYSFMQAIGMVNDHQIDCFRHSEIKSMKM